MQLIGLHQLCDAPHALEQRKVGLHGHHLLQAYLGLQGGRITGWRILQRRGGGFIGDIKTLIVCIGVGIHGSTHKYVFICSVRVLLLDILGGCMNIRRDRVTSKQHVFSKGVNAGQGSRPSAWGAMSH